MGAGASVDEHPEVVVAKKRVETLESELAALKATVAALQSSAGADGGAAPATPARSPAGGVTSPSDASGLGVSPPGVVGSASDDCDLFIVHFNDVYNIEPREKEPVGGAARFARYVKAARSDGLDGNGRRPLVLFSGDALNPSLMSTVTRGHQMVPVLNEIGVHVALVGVRFRSCVSCLPVADADQSPCDALTQPDHGNTKSPHSVTPTEPRLRLRRREPRKVHGWVQVPVVAQQLR